MAKQAAAPIERMAGSKPHKGQQIARMGSTGVSSGNHCDFRIKLNGTFLNPMNFL